MSSPTFATTRLRRVWGPSPRGTLRAKQLGASDMHEPGAHSVNHTSAGRSTPDHAWVPALTIVGLAVLSNGVALVLHIVRSAPLPTALLLTWGIGLLVVLLVIGGSEPWVRRELLRISSVGIATGMAATVAYDLSKTFLATLDPAPWNPFDALRVFGEALLGKSSPASMATAVGLIFHLSNGTTFGLGFTLLLGGQAAHSARRAVVLGAAWGLFLETFQLALFPGWMSIRFLDEFRQVSFGAHIVYGACLGLLVRWRLRAPSRVPSP